MLPQNGVNGTVDSNPYGAAVDQFGILWAPNLTQTGALFYFDTNNPTDQGLVQFPGYPSSPCAFYGIAIDGFIDPNTNALVQQIWLGDWNPLSVPTGVYRYRPVRDQGFAGLNTGSWAHVTFNARGRGVGVDNRTPTSFAWVALYDINSIGRIPTDIPDGSYAYPNGPPNTYATNGTQTIGTGVALDGDVWSVNRSSSNVSHFSVDAAGNVTGPPDIVNLDDTCDSNGQNCKPETFCGHANCKPTPYTYSDFTGFGLKNFTTPSGYYSWIQSTNCPAGQTRFLQVEWDAEQSPPDTAITMIARSSDDLNTLDQAPWTGQYTTSPADLFVAPGPLTPNPATYLQVLFELTSTGVGTPKLKSFKIVYVCADQTPN
ncbi:MAG: hypothetical protein JRI68_36195 [Deltaproteobacteria bacterium]|nr:hypothetical protein [Deltaproteobacteria bacterium]